jgi:hypothetical protein
VAVQYHCIITGFAGKVSCVIISDWLADLSEPSKIRCKTEGNLVMEDLRNQLTDLARRIGSNMVRL